MSTIDGKAHLDDLISQATIQYSKKEYDAAAELYAHATELQAESNGEMSLQNADLLYAYGRCLYHVAVLKSDVLGSKVVGEKPMQERSTKKSTEMADSSQTQAESENAILPKASSKQQIGLAQSAEQEDQASKPYFQFTGDENFDTSDEEEEDSEEAVDDAEDANEDEDDDFANAFEVLDMARILLIRKNEEYETDTDGYKSSGRRVLHERLADTYDLQAEILLEGERFQNAVVDLQSALNWKTRLYPPSSSIVAEAHYKLSLALEFSSVTQPRDENGEIVEGKNPIVDEVIRADAAKEMEAAIASCKLRILEESELTGQDLVRNSGELLERGKSKEIEEVKEMVVDMEQRLMELRQPPMFIDRPQSNATIDGAKPLVGVSGSILGEPAESRRTILENAAKGANDLSSLVKRKKPASGAVESEAPNTLQGQNGKRKVGGIESEDAPQEKRPKLLVS